MTTTNICKEHSVNNHDWSWTARWSTLVR